MQNLKHALALMIVTVGTVAVAMSLYEGRLYAEDEPQGPMPESDSSSSFEEEQFVDLFLTKTASITEAHTGERFIYTLTAENSSTTVDAQNVSIADTLPAGLILVSAPGCTVDSQELTCDVGTIAPGGTAVFDITVEVSGDQFLCGTELWNAATVFSGNDPETWNDTSEIATFVACPIQGEEESNPPEEQQGESAPFCGDGICDEVTGETCGACPWDCGMCLSEGPICGDRVCAPTNDCDQDCAPEEPVFAPDYEDEREAPSLERETLEVLPEQAVMQAIQEITETILEDRLLEERLREIDTEDGGPAEFFLGESQPTAAKKIYNAIRALQQEQDEFRDIARDVLQSPGIDLLLQNLPGKEEMQKAATQGDLSAVLDYLPPPRQSLSESLVQLKKYQNDLIKYYPTELLSHRGSLLLPRAMADEMSHPLDAKEALVESVFLQRRMAALGIDPRTGLPSLDHDIETLMNRRETLTGIIGITEVDLEGELRSAKAAVERPTTRSLLNVKGIFLYLHATANFQTLEKTYRSAVADMRTGMEQFRQLFSFHALSPSAQAAEMLGSDITSSLQSPAIEEKRQAATRLFDLQHALIESLLAELPQEKRSIHQNTFNRIRSVAGEAKTISSLQQAISSYADALDVLERDARRERGFIRRFFYVLQDFFGHS